MDKPKFCARDSSENPSTEGETMTSTDYETPFIKQFPPLPGEEEIPSIENDYSRAKAYLMRQCLSSGDNLWDHLNEVLRKILVERPRNIGCTFEEFSYRIKEAKFRPQTDHLQDVFVPWKHYELSQKLIKLFLPAPEKTDEENKTEFEEEIEKVEPDLLETFYYFEQGGVGLPREEVFCIALHLRKLMTEHPVEKFRFWGKILGTKKNYYVAETQLDVEVLPKFVAEEEEVLTKMKLEEQEKITAEKERLLQEKEKERQDAIEKEAQLAFEKANLRHEEMKKEAKARGSTTVPEKIEIPPWAPLPPVPQRTITHQVECPPEIIGIGSNKKVYFVCHGPGEKWIQLPSVTPQQIVAARNVRRAFTGDLESDVTTFPEFPGKEKNLLRAQIARISAGTQISPLGFYTFNEEDEEEEEVENMKMRERKSNYIVNPDFEPVAMRDLVDPSMSFWVHHTQYILGQGRTTWWNPKMKEETEEDEGEAEAFEEEDEPGREIGPELLTPLSEDSTLDSSFPWSVRKTSTLFPDGAVAIVRSNLWPGAYAFATDKKFGNVYIGNGQKLMGQNHSPLPLPDIQEEYPLGPEIMEMTDPTPEEEEAWRWAHEKKKVHDDEDEDQDGLDADDVDNEPDDEDEE